MDKFHRQVTIPSNASELLANKNKKDFDDIVVYDHKAHNREWYSISNFKNKINQDMTEVITFNNLSSSHTVSIYRRNQGLSLHLQMP